MVQPTATSQSEPVTSGPAAPPPAPTRPSGGRWRKWRARFIVLLLLAIAVLVYLRLSQNKATQSAQLDLGTVTLTAQTISVETPRTGQVTSVSIKATDKVAAGDEVGAVQVITTNSQGNPVTSTVKLTAPSGGVVVDDPVPVGTTLQPGQAFAELYDPTQFIFSGQVKLTDLPRIAPGMIATLTADGLDGTVKAVVQRLVPRVGDSQNDVKPDHMRVIMVPKSQSQVAGLVPGLQFTGDVDTGTGGGGHKPLVHLGS